MSPNFLDVASRPPRQCPRSWCTSPGHDQDISYFYQTQISSLCLRDNNTVKIMSTIIMMSFWFSVVEQEFRTILCLFILASWIWIYMSRVATFLQQPFPPKILTEILSLQWLLTFKTFLLVLFWLAWRKINTWLLHIICNPYFLRLFPS